jgi:hypothetical protein
VELKVDPFVWTKKERFFVTPVQVFPTGKLLLLLLRHPCGIADTPGETEVGSAGEHPAKG